MSETSEFETYEQIVAIAAKERKNIPIPNTTLTHAEIGLKYLFNTAADNSTAKIISNQFYEEFWLKLRNVLLSFLNRASSLEVILLKNIQSKTLDFLKGRFPDKVKYFYVAALTPSLKDAKKEIPHCTVILPDMYRIERSDDEMKDNIVKGFLNFGDSEGANLLNTFFDKIKSISKEVTSRKVSDQ
jgi:hypothetical protein